MKIKKSPLDITYGGNFDLRPTNRAATQIFKHYIPALYASNFNNLNIKDFQVQWPDDLAPYFCNAVWCENFTDLNINGFKGRQPQQAGPAILLLNGDGVDVQNAVAAKGTDVFLQMNNIKNQGLFNNNSLSKAKTIFGNGSNKFTMSGNTINK